jgi:protein ImuA
MDLMQLLSCHNGQLLRTALPEERALLARPVTFVTGLPALDELLPHGGFVRGAVHEVLAHPRQGVPRFFALLLARSASVENSVENSKSKGAIVWCDPRGEIYPPAVAALNIPLERLYLLHPKTSADQAWAIAECMRCTGVGATIAPVGRLSRIEARKLQLAAERGGGAGILLRTFDKSASVYAAATRWLVAPARGERTVQRWTVQLVHGHGGRVGHTVILEHHRETRECQAHLLREAAELADRPAATSPLARRASA